FRACDKLSFREPKMEIVVTTLVVPSLKERLKSSLQFILISISIRPSALFGFVKGGFSLWEMFVLMKVGRTKLILLLTLLVCAAVSGKAAVGDTLVVMPFENRSQMGEYNWIRESFAILLGDALDVPGIAIMSADERNMAFDKLRLSPNDLLTRAAMLRVANTSQSNLALIGEFDIGGEKENTTIAITARLIETREGRLVGNKVFNFSGPLSDLQQMQGQLAWNILYERNPTLPYSRDQLIRRAKNAPP